MIAKKQRDCLAKKLGDLALVTVIPETDKEEDEDAAPWGKHKYLSQILITKRTIYLFTAKAVRLSIKRSPSKPQPLVVTFSW